MSKTTKDPNSEARPNYPWLVFFPGDVIIEEYHGSVLVDCGGLVHVVNPIDSIRFVVDLDDTKICGHRKLLGLSYEEQIRLSREYIDRSWEAKQQRENNSK